MYTFSFHGDLEGATSPAYESEEAALFDLAKEWGWVDGEYRDKFGIRRYREHFLPDPEDDRVVLWEHRLGKMPKAVWHFSGWHWSFDAEELEGGPLDQGGFGEILAGNYWKDKSLYEIAMEE